MTHAVSLLYWLSSVLYDVLLLLTTGSTTTQHSDLLVHGYLHCNVQQAGLWTQQPLGSESGSPQLMGSWVNSLHSHSHHSWAVPLPLPLSTR